MWAVFIFIMGIVAIVLINIFGNITTTNQQDYTLIKNTTEAAMYDAIDYASSRAGFYLCFNKNINKTNGKYVFNSKDDYRIVRNVYNKKLDLSDARGTECDFLVGEIIINKEVFVESFLRRFSSDINNNKSYRVTIQDVIEYPPKVSLSIDTYDTYNSVESQKNNFDVSLNRYDYNIRNQIDAIFEEK